MHRLTLNYVLITRCYTYTVRPFACSKHTNMFAAVGTFASAPEGKLEYVM
jgi:hypothetical protein